MSRTTHLLRRGNRWVYNRAYPKELWPILGKSPFRRAFNTESLAEANRARPAMDQEYWRTVDQARLSMAASASRPALALRDAEALAATWFRKTLARQEERRRASSLDNLGDRGDKPWLVTGTPGGSTIIDTVLQLIVNTTDFGLNVDEATHQPRIYQGTTENLRVEPNFNPDTVSLLKAKGHKITFDETMGSAQSILIEDGLYLGAADPRRPGARAIAP